MDYPEAFRAMSKLEDFLMSEEKWDELQASQQAILATKADRLNRAALHRIVNGHSGFQLMKMSAYPSVEDVVHEEDVS